MSASVAAVCRRTCREPVVDASRPALCGKELRQGFRLDRSAKLVAERQVAVAICRAGKVALERERRAGLPKAQGAWQARNEQIEAELRAAIGQADEQCIAAKQAAAGRAENERAELGEYPALKNEAVAV